MLSINSFCFAAGIPPGKLSYDQLQDYGGGSNPILWVSFLVLCVLGIAALIGTYVWWRYRRELFYRVAIAQNLSNTEFGFLKSYATRFHVKMPEELVTKHLRFDNFINRVAHQYESAEISEETLLQDAMFLKAIRKKLKFSHSYREKRLRCSRSLPVKHPVSVDFVDPDTGNRVSFHSKVVHNNEFFLGIQPPDAMISADIFGKGKLPLHMSLIREGDAHYEFETVFIRRYEKPVVMWAVRHSTELRRGYPHDLLELPGVLFCTECDEDDSDSSERQEHPVTVTTLTREGCRFVLIDKTAKLATPSSGLLQVDIDGREQLLRCEVTSEVVRKDSRWYRVRFTELEKEQRLRLHQHLKDRRESPNAAGSLPSGSSKERARTPQNVED